MQLIINADNANVMGRFQLPNVNVIEVQLSVRHSGSMCSTSWMKLVHEGSYAGALLVDLSKAFDTVPHQLLLTELCDIGWV